MALIDDFGEMQLIVGTDSDPELVLHGNVCCDLSVDESVTGQRYRRNGSDRADLSLSLSNGRLVGEFDYRGEHRFDLASSNASQASLTLQQLAAVYTRTSTPIFGVPETLTLSITATGELTGSNTNGCTYNGRVSIPSSSRNLIRMDVQMTGCASLSRWNGAYRGLGLLRGANGGAGQHVLYYSWVGPTWLGTESIQR